MAYAGDVWLAAVDAWKSRSVEVFRHSMEFQRVVREAAKMGYSAEDAFVTVKAPKLAHGGPEQMGKQATAGGNDVTHDERRRQQHEAATAHWQKKIDQERGQQSATAASVNQQRTEARRQQGELEVEPEKRGRSRSL